MDYDFLSLLGVFINYLIFIYIFLNLINTDCFDVGDMYITLFGLILSVFIYIVDIFNRRVMK